MDMDPVKITEHMTLRYRGNEINCVTASSFTMKKTKDDADDQLLYCHKNGDFLLFNIDDLKTREVPGYDPIISADSTLIASCSKDEVTMTIRDVKTMNSIRRCKLNGVNFWNWISPTVIGLVGKTAVFHWSIEKDRPVKMFTLDPRVYNPITGYVCDLSERFLAVSSVSFKHRSIQLYTVETKTSRMFDGMNPVFVTIRGKTYLCFVTMDDELAHQNMSSSIFNIVEVPSTSSAEPTSVKFVVNPNVTPRPCAFAAGVSLPGFDTIIGSAASKYGVVFVLSALGNVVAFDVATTRCVYRKCLYEGLEFKVSDFQTIGTYRKGDDEGIIGATRNGKIVSISVDREITAQYLQKVEVAASAEVTTKKKKKNRCGSRKKKKAGTDQTQEEQKSDIPAIGELSVADEAPTTTDSADSVVAVDAGNVNEEAKEGEGEENKLCIVCYENPCNAVFVPCGHMWFCFGCADEIKKKEGTCRPSVPGTSHHRVPNWRY
jgi:hypothetical protein